MLVTIHGGLNRLLAMPSLMLQSYLVIQKAVRLKKPLPFARLKLSILHEFVLPERHSGL